MTVDVAVNGTAMEPGQNEFTVQELPAVGQPRTTTEAELDQLTRDALSAVGYGNPTERLTFQVAAYLQQHPRKQLTVADVATGTGLSGQQVAGVLRDFVALRTDVDRARRGVYIYHPGRGVGIRPKPSKPPVPGRPSKPATPGKPVVPVKPATPGKPDTPGKPQTYADLPGAKDKAGRAVVQRADGQLFAVEAI
jgi:hypothetical protein